MDAAAMPKAPVNGNTKTSNSRKPLGMNTQLVPCENSDQLNQYMFSW
jgi:hypothetical protein